MLARLVNMKLDAVTLSAGVSFNGNVYAVDPRSGTEKWRLHTQGHPNIDRPLSPESARTARALRPVQ
jgi:outer membrane protein assembly factor BamB